MLTEAIQIATEAHKGQFRKASDLPYIVHPLDVMNIVRLNVSEDEFYLSVAVLHDVIEDCESYYNYRIMNLSTDLHEAIMYLTKSKTQEDNKIASAPEIIQLIKVADIYSNTRDALSKKYLVKKLNQLNSMTVSSHMFFKETKKQILFQM